MKRKPINNTFDLILLLIYLGIGFYFSFEAYIGKLIPMKYILIFVLFLFISFIGIFLTFKNRNQIFRFLRKIILILLCMILGYGTLFQGQLRSAFLNVTGSIISDKMHVLTLKEYEFESIQEIDTLGYFNQKSDLLEYSLTQINDLNKKSYPTIEDEFHGLDIKEIDAILISEKDLSFYENQLNEYKVIHSIEMIVENTMDFTETNLNTKPFVIYLAGIDDMGKPTRMGHHDVNMLLMVDPIDRRVEIVSINRDAYVPNSELNHYPDKLTHFGWYGVEMASDTLEKVFGIEIDYYVKVTFESFVQIIDAMGGIDVDVKIDFSEQDENRSFDQTDLIHLDKGYQHLNGREALAYARHRKTEGWDVKGREQAQSDIIKAIVHKMMSIDGALKLKEVIQVATNYVSTNMPIKSAKAFINHTIGERKKWSFSSTSTQNTLDTMLKCAMEGGIYRSVSLLSEKDIQKVHDLYMFMYYDNKLSDFVFDLNDLNNDLNTFTLDKHVITIENYYDVVPKYFFDYLDYPI